MLVHLPSKRLVLNLQNPARVTTVIPTARTFEFKGATLTAVPHRLDEVRVLRNMGIQAPSPILHHYSWPISGPHDPFHAQKMTGQFLTLNPKAFVLNDMGTGKTLATLWAYDFLRSIGVAVKLLVLSPLSTLERTWGDEIFRHFPHLTFCVMHGDKAKRLRLLADDYDVYIINHHGIRVIEKELIERGFDTLVVDEGAIFRNASTELWKSLNRIARGFDRIWWLTGTPTPNAPTDAWAQCRIVCPERVPKFFGKFRDQVMKQSGPFRWVAREGATELVREAMQPAVRFTRDQCIDLPPCLYQTREVPMTPEQKTAYKGMLTHLYMQSANGEEVQAINEAAKVNKLLQIACGVVYGTQGEEVVLPNKPRIDEVYETIEQAATKAIVFVPFKSVLGYVAGELETRGLKVGRISGDVPAAERGRIFQNFQNGSLDVLVAQPAAMSHGLTLTAANTVIWYSAVNSNETYEQANARVTRPGQKHTQFIVHIEGSPVERKAFARLQGKQKMQGMFLELVREDSLTS